MIDNISLVSNNFYNPQITSKVANVNGTNLANNAANQSAFSSYIETAFAQLRVANPTINTAPVISATDKSSLREDDTQKSISSFIQDLFSILSQKNSEQTPTIANQTQSALQNQFSQESEFSESGSTDNESSEVNTTALAAYTADSSTTVGNILANIQKLVDNLNLNPVSDNSNSSKIQSIQNSFQSILGAQGATPENPTSLAAFLQTLAQNLEGQSPLGIIINTQA